MGKVVIHPQFDHTFQRISAIFCDKKGKEKSIPIQMTPFVAALIYYPKLTFWDTLFILEKKEISGNYSNFPQFGFCDFSDV